MRPNSEQLLPGQVFARRVKEARESRGWSQQQLVEELERLGYPLARSSLAKLENEHSTRADARLRDVLALSAALGISPLYLLTPHEDRETVAVTPRVSLPAWLLRGWIRGELQPPMLQDVDLDQLPDSELVPHVEQYLTEEIERSTVGSPLARQAALMNVKQMARERVKQMRNVEREEAPVA